MKIIDTHAHLDHIDSLENALEQADKEGVKAIIAVGVDLKANIRNLEIAETVTSPKIFLAFGMHPGNINLDEFQDCLDLFSNNIEKAVAIGEIGLDFWYKWVKKNSDKKDEQRDIFRKQLVFAKDHELPVVIHSRGAWRECYETTKDIGINKALFHWYSGPVDVLRDILSAGYYISATPSLAYSKHAREAVNFAPIEQTLIETDCPVFFRSKAEDFMQTSDRDEYMKGFSSSPKDVVRTLRSYVEMKNIDQQKALDILNHNAELFFNIGVPW